MRILKDSKSSHRETYTSMFTHVLFTIAREWNHPRQSPTDERIKTMWYTDMRELYVAIDKCKIMPFSGCWIEVEITVLNGIRQT